MQPSLPHAFVYQHLRNVMSNNLTKRDIVLKIFTDKGYPQKHIRDSVQMTLDAISEALLAGRDVELRNFGVFQVQVRKSRIGRNPNRPETDVVIPKRAVIKFKAGKELKAKLKSIDVEKPSQPQQ
ncbi:MAG: HU family DNA-binding protein [Opitutales bacterium]